MKRTFVAGAAVVASLLVAAGCSEKMQKQPDENVPVSAVAALSKDIPMEVHAIGNVQPYSTVEVHAQVSGQLMTVHFHEGDSVKRGQLLFSIDPRTYRAAVAEAEANLARDEAELRNAEAEAKRYEQLAQKDYVTAEQADKTLSAAESARATIAGDRAQLDNARLQLSYCEIHSPLDGRTGSLTVHAGNLVRANDTTPLVTIYRIEPIYVSFAVPERQLADINTRRASGKLDVQVQIPATGRNIGGGELTFVDNGVDQTTGTITMKATFANRDASLWPGQFVNVSVLLSTRTNAVVVPDRAIQNGQRGDFVYVVKDSKATQRSIVTGPSVNGETIVEKGVAAGETVVIDGQIRLKNGSPVTVKREVAQGAIGS